jgi:hypothetical protein
MAHKSEGSPIEKQDQPVQTFQTGDRFFQIKVKGHLSADWAEWFEGLELACLDNGEMLLSGIVLDQAALMGVLAKLHRLNLTILSVNELNRMDGSDRETHRMDPAEFTSQPESE